MENRVIKFRALCEYETELNTHISMVYFGLPEMDNGLWAFPIDKSIRHINSHESPLMQFTGLHDKNGKEIYEGDILEHNGKVQKVVFYNTNKGAYYCQFNTGGGFVDNIMYFIQRDCEVIGNIYENPELLNK